MPRFFASLKLRLKKNETYRMQARSGNLLALFACALALLSACCAMPLTGRIEVGDGSAVSNIKLSLNGGEFQSITTVDGAFIFHSVPSGIYLLDVLSPVHHFSQLKIKVDDEAETVAIVEYKYPGAPKQTAQYPIVLQAHGKPQYFEQRQAFGVMSMLKSPMAFSVLMTLGMVIFLPKLMSGVDKEEMKEMQKQMADNDPQKMLSNLFGAKPKDDDEDD